MVIYLYVCVVCVSVYAHSACICVVLYVWLCKGRSAQGELKGAGRREEMVSEA